ncbi:MAG: histidine kinase [Rhodococcus sp. (in: high G+C Gram-positive bacteria)]|nr:histidine kinase [Rhodococcus sp. (in: high G+C Gram-positive bacteria)]
MNVNHRMRNGEWMFDSAGQNAPGQALASRGWGRFNLNNPATAAVIVGLLSVPWVFGLASLKTEPETSNRVLSDPGTVVGIMGFLTVLTVVACARRRYPIAYYLLTLAGSGGLMLFLGSRSLGATPLFWFAIMAVSIRVSGMRLVGLLVLGMAMDVILAMYLTERDGLTVAEVQVGELPHLFLEPAANTVTSFLVVAAMGKIVARLRKQAMENSHAVADLHRDRERKIANAVVAERQDMARELHDVAAHHMTGMIIQARAADKFFSSNPEQAQALLGGVIEQGQRALNSLRQIVGILRLGEEDPDFPTPMVSDIDELVDDCRRTISSISLEKVGRFDDLDSGVQLTCYRIVQEALSNVLRHAPGSESKVCLSREAGAVRVRVINTLGNSRPASDGQNLGIVGMRERATLMGGQLDAGPNSEGEWAVQALVPVNGRINA